MLNWGGKVITPEMIYHEDGKREVKTGEQILDEYEEVKRRYLETIGGEVDG